MIGQTSWWVALWLLLRCLLAGWILAGGLRSIWPIERTLIVVDGLVGSPSLSSALLSDLLLGWLAEVQRVWDLCDDRLQYIALADVLRFDESLLENDVSRAWMVWSGAAETALDDAYCFAGGHPGPGLEAWQCTDSCC